MQERQPDRLTGVRIPRANREVVSTPSGRPIVITGARGQLGSELCRQFGDVAVGLDLPDWDLTDSDQLRRSLQELQPWAVINAAAYTQVDQAESDAQRCHAINAHPVAQLADICNEISAGLVQISTDYVFAGWSGPRQPLQEADSISPYGVYSESKALAEAFAAEADWHIVVRTCGLYAMPRTGEPFQNFVLNVLRQAGQRDRLAVVNDQQCTPSYVPHVAAAIHFLVCGGQDGLYHVVNRGTTTWHGFATELFRQMELEICVDPLSTTEFAAPAPRPTYSVLSTAKYDALGGPPLPDWQAAIAEFIMALRNSPLKND